MTKILLTGSEGQLGKSILRIANHEGPEVTGVDIKEMDITNPESIDAQLQKKKYDLVINAAAYTNVDRAEEEYDKAVAVNGTGVRYLADACRKADIPLIHISTDYVFDGRKEGSYSETDMAAPINAYGRSKLQGEQAIARSGANALIIRTAWLYSEYGNNFVKTMLRLGSEGKSLRVIDDQWGCPTYAGDLAEAVLFLSEQRFNKGVTLFHITNNGKATWYMLAKKALEMEGIKTEISPVTTEEYGSSTNRPMRSIMSNKRLEMLTGFKMPLWESGLEKCIMNMK